MGKKKILVGLDIAQVPLKAVELQRKGGLYISSILGFETFRLIR